MEHDPSDLLTTKQAAHLAEVTPAAVRQWVTRGHLKVATNDDGEEIRDKRGRPFYWRIDVAKAEYKTRKAARRYVSFAA